MLESEAKTKICPYLQPKQNIAASGWGIQPVCWASGCMMWNWEMPESNWLEALDYQGKSISLEEVLAFEHHKNKPKEGWELREDKKRFIRMYRPDERQGGCGLMNLNVYVEGP